MSIPGLSNELAGKLLQKLDAYHPHQPASTSDTEDESDSKLVLRRIVECGRYESDEEIEKAVEEYVGGKPLAYITGEWWSVLCLASSSPSCGASLRQCPSLHGANIIAVRSSAGSLAPPTPSNASDIQEHTPLAH